MLVLGSLVHALDVFAGRLYSISCLAAHDAIRTILEQVGFRHSNRQDRNFVHEELKLDGLNIDELTDTLVAKTAAAIHATNFHMRQRRTGA